MSLGSLALKLKQKYQHGLQTAYYRDWVRKQILKSLPIKDTADAACEIHAFTSASDWLNLIWALKSFYYFSQRRYGLCIHGDGTLIPEYQEILQHHFPQARIISKQIADERMISLLAAYPRCLELRQSNHLAPKVFDFLAYLDSDRLLLVDSDVLFFQNPDVLIARIESPNYLYNSLNGDVASAYTVQSIDVKNILGFELKERINSGLGLIHKQSLRLDWLEEFLSLSGIIGHFWRIEQTLYALCSSRFGIELLPPAYDVRLNRGINNSPCRHYVGAIRHLMYGEGIKHLVKNNFLKNLNT